MKQNRFVRMACVLFIAALQVACATTANVDYREGYDFSAIKNVRIMAQQPASSDSRVNSPLVDERVRKSIAASLAAQGVSAVDENADAVLAYQVSTRGGVESYDSGISVGYGSYSRHSLFGIGYGFPWYDVESYDEMVLTIDFLAISDNTMLWRGSSSKRLADGSTPEKMTDMVNELVSDILMHFPPGKK